MALKKYKVKRRFKEDIEPEEILMDSKRLKESSDAEREKIETPIKQSVLKIFFAFIVIVLIGLLFKTFQTQLIKGDYWRNLADENRIRSYPIKALRGIIYDRNKIPLAINVPNLDLIAIPADLARNENYDEIIGKLASKLGRKESEIREKIEKNIHLPYPIVIQEDLEREKAFLLESEFIEVSGLNIRKSSRRQYEDGPMFAHVLGYLGKVNEEEVAEGDYLFDDYVGRTGLENIYENLLRGKDGEELVEIDNLGRTQKVLANRESKSGNDLILSIDAELQKKLYQAFRGKRGAAIALDPRNGKILALISFPSFDNNNFIKGLAPKLFSQIFENKDLPLFNRAISGTYPSGSVIKPLIAAAALQEEIINPNKQINCPGYLSVVDKYNPNIFWTFKDWKAHGATNMIKAIAESSNVYFYTIGGGYGDIDGLGIDKIAEYLKAFGWGQKLGIDLPGEESGFIPSAQWKEETKGERWYIGDTYNVSIGQGDIAVSPLQITMAIAAIANGGKLFQPQLLNDKEPKIINQDFIKKEFLEVVRRGMREAVVSGSARSLNDLPVEAAGKTGTAEVSKTKSPHGWFTVFAPYDQPEIILTILVENGGEGSSAAAPVAKEVLTWYFK